VRVVPETTRGWAWGEGRVWGRVVQQAPQRQFVLNFQVKMQDFVHFYCEQLVASNRDHGGLIDGIINSWGLKL